MIYPLCYRIIVGNYRLNLVDSVKIKKAVDQLSDTATITLPMYKHKKQMHLEDKIKKGDKVAILLGYSNLGDPVPEFRGYVQKVSNDNNQITIDCIDELFKWDVPVKNEQLQNVSLKALLIKLAAQVDPEYSVVSDYEFTYAKFTIFEATALDVLKKIQEDTKGNIYFLGKTLHVNTQYNNIATDTVVFDLAQNIEASSLKYVQAADKKLQIKLTYRNGKGQKKEKKFGVEGGQVIERNVSGISEASLMEAAKNEYNLWNYDGYEGDFTGWLVPYVEPNWQVLLNDQEQSNRIGLYYVKGTEVTFSREGGKRKITIGRRLN